MTENKALQLGYESNGLKVLSPIPIRIFSFSIRFEL